MSLLAGGRSRREAAGPVSGFVATGFEAVAEELEDIVADDPGYSAQFCAFVDGRLVVDVWAGPDAEQDAIGAVFSATKGVSAICIGLLVQRGVLDLDAPVSRYWPEFAQGGKGEVTVRVALSHQAGLAGVEPQLTLEQLLDHGYTAERVAAQVPHWLPGSAHGYHPTIIGTLMDELVRRTDGRPLARFFREEIGDPRGIDFFIEVPPEQEERLRDTLPMEPTPAQLRQSADLLSPAPEPDSMFGMAMNAVHPRASSLLDLVTAPATRRAGHAAVGGAGSARGMARHYAGCIDEVDGMPRLLTPETVAAMTQIQTVGEDLVLGLPTRYAIVFQKSDDRLWYGSHQAFGHDGAGGAIGVADPWHHLAYGYIPRRMSFPGGADERGMRLAAAVRESLDR